MTRSLLPIVMVGGCSVTDIALTIDRIDPDRSAVGASLEVTIHGRFHPEPLVSYWPGRSSGANITFSASLDEHALENVSYTDQKRLTAVIPTDVGVGTYALTVRGPRGDSATLPEAFVVFQSTGADGGIGGDDGDPNGGDPAVGDPSGDGGDPAVGDPNGGGGDPAVGDPAVGDPAVGDPNGDGGDPAVGDPSGGGGDPAVGDPNGGDSLTSCDACTSGPCAVQCTASPCTTDCALCDCDIQCAEVDACRADCISSAGCSMNCSNVADCRTDCSGTSSCDIVCTGGSCTVDCWENATCDINCTNAQSCQVDCVDPAQCLLDFSGASSYGWGCSGAVTTCSRTVVACNRACP